MIVNQLLLDNVGKIAQAAGDLLLDFWHKPLHIQQKPSAGIVTQADKASEQFIIERLAVLEPGIGVWAEERGDVSNHSEWCWVIDPLDGTTNFAYHLPYFCISIALTHHNVPQLAVIYNPITRELFTASKNNGAFCNGVAIKVSKRSLADCVVGICFPYVETSYGWADPVILSVWPHVMDIRRMGAAALDLANAAAGRFDAVFFRRIAWWDIAAGMLLVQEAGGKATEFAGAPLTPDYQSLIAGEPFFVDWFCQLIKE